MVRIEEFQVKAALPAGENPLPFFRAPHHDVSVQLTPDVPEEYRQSLGLDCGFRMLPYLRQDRYDRLRAWTPLKTIILENNHLKASFLPSLGGRLISLYDKDGKRELLYDNWNIQVANLANRDAWFAGGIEWNVGQYGHGFSTCSDVYFAKVSGDHIRMYSYERCKGLWWRVDFFLSEGDRMLTSIVTIDNQKPTRQSLYAWVNTAVSQTETTRVFASNTHALYLDIHQRGQRVFGYMDSPDTPLYPGMDASYPARWPVSEEYFFTCNHDPMPWEVSIQEDGRGLMEVSSPILGYRKMFCWGTGKGGRNWQRFLAPEREGSSYVEIQAGLAPTQLHGAYIEGYHSVRWVQMFGPIAIRRSQEYHKERETVIQMIQTIVDPANVAREEKRRRVELDSPEQEILHHDDGWSYLEKQANQENPGVAYHVRREDVSERLLPWLDLVEAKKVPRYDPLRIPPVIGDNWLALLKAGEGEPMSLSYWSGIMLAEQGKDAEAMELFQIVHTHMHDAFSARNIAQLLLRAGKTSQARLWYQAATYSTGYGDDPAIAEEYIALLREERDWPMVHETLAVLPSRLETGRIRMEKAILASHENNPTLLSRLLDEGFPNVREGEAPFEDLWVSLLYMRLAPHEKKTDKMTKELLAAHPLPERLSFSMTDEPVASTK